MSEAAETKCVFVDDIQGTNCAEWQCPVCKQFFASPEQPTCKHVPPKPTWEASMELELALFGHTITHDGRNTR